MARQKAMMTVGGENPWEVGVNKEVVQGQQDLETVLEDSAKGKGGEGLMRKFSFWEKKTRDSASKESYLNI